MARNELCFSKGPAIVESAVRHCRVSIKITGGESGVGTALQGGGCGCHQVHDSCFIISEVCFCITLASGLRSTTEIKCGNRRVKDTYGTPALRLLRKRVVTLECQPSMGRSTTLTSENPEIHLKTLGSSMSWTVISRRARRSI